MDFDPKKMLEIGGGLIDGVKFISKASTLFSSSKPKTRRKADWDPNFDADRRISPVELRLRTGIWLHFHRKTGLGKTQRVESPVRGDLIQAFVSEAVSYQFSTRETNTLLLPGSIAGQAADATRIQWMEIPIQDREALLLTDTMADYVLANYVVRRNDRRRGKPVQSVAV